MAVCTALVPLGWTDVVTYALSVAAIVITGIVLIQGYRDTAAIHAKLDEIIVALNETRNDVVGIEKEEPEKIKAAIEKIEPEAGAPAQLSGPVKSKGRKTGARPEGRFTGRPRVAICRNRDLWPWALGKGLSEQIALVPIGSAHYHFV